MKKQAKKATTKADLIVRLETLAKSFDTEGAHCDADDALIEFINDKDIEEAYHKVPKWYA